MVRVPLVNGGYMVVDAEDAERVGAHRWKWYVTGTDLTYAQTTIARRLVRAHRFVLDLGPGDGEVDHANGYGLDNRRDNLRLVTRAQNMANSQPRTGGTSRYKGVSAWKGRWVARIRVDGKDRRLGLFADENEAARAYDLAALEVWGPHARLNRDFFGD